MIFLCFRISQFIPKITKIKFFRIKSLIFRLNSKYLFKFLETEIIKRKATQTKKLIE